MKCPGCGNALSITARDGRHEFCSHGNRRVWVAKRVVTTPSTRQLIEMAKWRRPGDMPTSPRVRLICSRCPACGCPEYSKVRPNSFVALTHDRVCENCDTRYSPPTPGWAAAIFFLVGLGLLVGGGAAAATSVVRDGYVMALVQVAWALVGLFCLGFSLSAFLQYVRQPPKWKDENGSRL